MKWPVFNSKRKFAKIFFFLWYRRESDGFPFEFTIIAGGWKCMCMGLDELQVILCCKTVVFLVSIISVLYSYSLVVWNCHAFVKLMSFHWVCNYSQNCMYLTIAVYHLLFEISICVVSSFVPIDLSVSVSNNYVLYFVSSLTWKVLWVVMIRFRLIETVFFNLFWANFQGQRNRDTRALGPEAQQVN